jgi:hypothetical protein
VLAACGDTSTQAAWVSGHPDTTLLSFQSNAPGVCAITVQYPNDAPAAIQYLGSVYVQVARESRPPAPTGQRLDTSGDWVIVKLDDGELLVITPANAYRYRVETNC